MNDRDKKQRNNIIPSPGDNYLYQNFNKNNWWLYFFIINNLKLVFSLFLNIYLKIKRYSNKLFFDYYQKIIVKLISKIYELHKK
jgi:hypothetical protein